jgi:4-hydroxybenzoate polyprenyltransferase
MTTTELPQAPPFALVPLLRDWGRSLRPRHWIKNVFVLSPLIFAEGTWDSATAMAVGTAFLLYCLLCSALYLINDVVDRPQDLAHPRKRHRAIAAGRISAGAALAVAGVLGAGAAALAFTLPGEARWLALAYAVNTLAYIFWLKDRVILDVLLIALGFLIRVLTGCAAGDVEPTGWIAICAFSLALVLGFGKRRCEVAGSSGSDPSARATLISYDIPKLNTLLAICTATTLMAYMLYTVSPETVLRHGTTKLIYTVPVVAYGLFRYLFKTMEAEGDGPTEIITTDPVFVLTGLLWGVSVLAVLAWK